VWLWPRRLHVVYSFPTRRSSDLPRRRFKGHVTPREKIYKIWQQMFLDGFVSDISDAALDKYVERLTARRNGGQGVSTLAWCHGRSEEHTSELQSRFDLVCRLLLE